MKATTIYIILNSLDEVIVKTLDKEDSSSAIPIARGMMFCKGIRDTNEMWCPELGHVIESKDKKDYCIVRSN